MTVTVARAARSAGDKVVPAEVIEQGLTKLGARAEQPLDAVDRHGRATAVSQFVRQLRGARLEAIHDLERLMLVQCEAAPTGVQDVLLADAISVIRARNHLGQVAKSIGMEWADGMKLQSALGDPIRAAGSGPGGLLQTTVEGSRAEIVLKVNLADGQEGPDLSSLAGLRSLGARPRIERAPGSVRIHLTLRSPAGEA